MFLLNKTNVFLSKRRKYFLVGQEGKCFVEKGKVRAHIIMQQPKPFSRWARQEFEHHRVLKVKKHTPTGDALYVQSIGVDKGLIRRGIPALLISSYKTHIWLHADSAAEIASYQKMGFRNIAPLQEFDRSFMVK